LRARFRLLGGQQWTAATTVDVSSSGVLLQATDVPPLYAAIEFRFALNGNGGGSPKGEVSGEGRVVRQLSEKDPGRFAVCFEQFDMRPFTRAFG
jgi:hypothetical protein